MTVFNWKTIIIGTIAVLAVMSGLQVLRAPDKILDDVLVSEDGKQLILQIKFNVPVRYENHFPEKQGRVVQVKLRPVSLSDTAKNEYLGSESILPGFMQMVPITDIAYEGMVPGGPYLTLRFKSDVRYSVSEDADFKSIIFTIPKKS